MLFIRVNEIDEVVMIHHQPELLTDEQLQDGILLDITEIPQPNIQLGKGAKLFFTQTDGLHYKYFDVPLTPEEQLTLLQKAVNINVDQAKKEQEIRDKINVGEITAKNFSALPTDEQDLVKLVLFKDYSPTKEDIPKALSAIEFGLVALFKLLGKAIDRTKLTQEEQDFLDAMVGVVGLNDMPINDTTDWRFQYFQQQFEHTQQNRQEYFSKKMSVIGII
jgi:hypothetical protein